MTLPTRTSILLAVALVAALASRGRGQDAPAPAPSPSAQAPAPAPAESPAAPAPAPRPGKLSLADLEDAFLDVADRVRPGVVAIEAKHEGEEESELGRSIGFSGVVWDEDGTIVAIGRDLESATEITVAPLEGEPLKAKFLGLDDETGVAVLKVEGDGKKSLRVLDHGQTSSLRAGCFCVAVGNPAGLHHSVAFGHVAAVGRTVKRGLFVTKDAIQVTLSVNPGDPGGLLADSRGRMVGVLTSALRRPETLKFDKDLLDLVRRFFRPPGERGGDHGGDHGDKPGEHDGPPKGPELDPGLDRLAGPMRRALEGSAGAFAQNVGFALPVEEVAKAVERVKRAGGQPWLGVDVTLLDDDDRKDMGIDDERGILVVGVRAGSPAAKAGLKANDVVLSWNGTPVGSPRELQKVVRAAGVGTEVKLEVQRGKEKLPLAVRIEARGTAGDPSRKP